ncbi:hypothetical protein V6N11_024882 [Hibiscus sabdariffa]|uniref:Major facilitator superfamily (MFS) profile domain-containing protein n=1 Tax=Hibiscus sabdariffa TaxID=183260 RepID=A0ABR2QNY6_9ROSI
MDVENGESSGRSEIKQPLIQTKHESKSKGLLKVVLLSTFVAVLGSYEFGSCMGYSAPVQPAITEDLHLSIAEAMRVSSAFSITGWIAIYFSQVPIYVAEIAPKDLRGGLATLNQLMIVIGGSVSFLAGTALQWRPLALTGIIPCLIQLVGLVFIPESPRWLAKVGYEKEFYNALRRLHGDNDDDISHEANEIQDYLQTLKHQSKASMLDLFQRKYMHSIIIGVGLMMFQQFGGINGVGFYASQTFTSAGFIDRHILRMLYCSYLISNEVNVHAKTSKQLMSECQQIFEGSFAVGMGAVPWVLMSEIFPINVKGVAGSLVNLEHWFGAWAVSYTFNFLVDWSPPGVCAASVVFVAKVVPETKGRTLEEIQASINS